MPRGTSFGVEYVLPYATEQVRIKSYHEAGMGICQIAAKLNRHRNSIANFLKKAEHYGKTKISGAKPKVDARAVREIKRFAIGKNLSANQIRKELVLNISTRRVQQILSSDDNILYQKRLAKPMLTERHKNARLQFAEKYKFWDDEWHFLVFSDEKTFSLDGPDGNQLCWQDKRLPRPCREARNFGGGSLMTWAAFSYRGKSEMCFVSHKMNSEKYYVELLDEVLVEFAGDLYGNEWTFQQDNAPIQHYEI